MPIGQLDGGHILYGLLRRRAHFIATGLLCSAIAGALYFHLVGWSLMLVLLVLMGPKHPPTNNDELPLGLGRSVLGWLMLAFLPFGFTPDPIQQVPGFGPVQPPAQQRRFVPPPSDDQRWVRHDADRSFDDGAAPTWPRLSETRAEKKPVMHHPVSAAG